MRMTQGLFEFDWNSLFALITFLVLFLILKHFFFEKIHNFMEERAASVQKTLDHAAETDRKAEERLRTYEEKIDGAEAEGRQIIADARKTADAQADRILEDANARAEEALRHSRQELERETASDRKQLRREVGELATEAAGRILQKELNPETHREIIDRVLEEADRKYRSENAPGEPPAETQKE